MGVTRAHRTTHGHRRTQVGLDTRTRAAPRALHAHARFCSLVLCLSLTGVGASEPGSRYWPVHAGWPGVQHCWNQKHEPAW